MGTKKGFESMIAGLQAEQAARIIRARRAFKRDGVASCKVSWGMVVLTRSARRPGAFQITSFGADGTPWGHTERDDEASALKEFASECHSSRAGKKKRSKADQRRPKGALGPAQLVKRRLVRGKLI